MRVVGRVLIVPPQRRTRDGEPASVRGWRSFVGIPVGFASVTVHMGDTTHQVVADRGGVVDAMIKVDLEPGWQTFQISV